ncbi:site-specific integrase [Escherichia coli]|nr:site-specific integrase [Escherichia coli]
MASIRKLPSGKYNVQIRKYGEKPISASFSSLELAEEFIATHEKPARIKIADLYSVYLDSVMIRNGKKRGGYSATDFRLQTLYKNLSVDTLEAITVEVVLAYRDMRLNHVSGSTVRLELQLLSRLLRWAKAEKGIDCVDHVASVKLPEPGKAREAIVEPDDLRKILKWASEKSKPIIELAYETAMRRNEILAITPYMVDFDKRIIRLMDDMTKNGEARKVPLTLKAVELLKDLCKGKGRHERIFDLTPYAVTQAFRRAARIAEVENVCFHSLRHTAITRAAEKGLSTVQLMAVSGHKTISMLSRYSHVKAENIAHLLD